MIIIAEVHVREETFADRKRRLSGCQSLSRSVEGGVQIEFHPLCLFLILKSAVHGFQRSDHELAYKATNCEEGDKSETGIVGALLVSILPLDASFVKTLGA